MKKIYLTLFAFIAIVLTTSVNAQTNVTSSGMSIQGIARDENNAALANIDQLELAFNVYYLAGSTETAIVNQTATVKTDNFGVFSYVLVIDQAQYNLISTQSAYLKVTQGSVVFSNEKLQAVPYAVYAQNGVPTGSIIPFIGTTAPNGWLLCNGTAIPSGAYYDNLKALAGTNTPDLRAMFLRGAGSQTAYPDKVGPAIKVVQPDDIKAHLHTVALTTNSSGAHYHFLNRRSNSDSGAYDSGDSNLTEESGVTTNRAIIGKFSTLTAGDHTHNINGSTANTGGTETRPINYGVNYIIKI